MRKSPNFSVAAITFMLATAAFGTVFVPPPTYEDITGPFFGAFAGSTVQRLNLNSDRTGEFADVYDDANGNHVDRYTVRVSHFRDGNFSLLFAPVGGGRTIRASGTGDHFELKVTIGETPRYRRRDLVLHREQGVLSMLATAQDAMKTQGHP